MILPVAPFLDNQILEFPKTPKNLPPPGIHFVDNEIEPVNEWIWAVCIFHIKNTVGHTANILGAFFSPNKAGWPAII